MPAILHMRYMFVPYFAAALHVMCEQPGPQAAGDVQGHAA